MKNIHPFLFYKLLVHFLLLKGCHLPHSDVASLHWQRQARGRPNRRADKPMPTVGRGICSDDQMVGGLYGCFQKIWIPQNGWCILENHIKMDDLGVPLFSETPISR